MGNKLIKMDAIEINNDAIRNVQPCYIVYYIDKSKHKSVILTFAIDMQNIFYEKIKDAIHTNKQITIYCHKAEINCVEITYPIDKSVERETYRSKATVENDDEYFYINDKRKFY